MLLCNLGFYANMSRNVFGQKSDATCDSGTETLIISALLAQAGDIRDALSRSRCHAPIVIAQSPASASCPVLVRVRPVTKL